MPAGPAAGAPGPVAAGTAAPAGKASPSANTPAPKPQKPKGGYVQRPDAPRRGTIDDAKPLTSPLPRPKKAGPLHPPSRKPAANPKAGLFTSPRPAPGKPRHTGNTSPRPKHDPNPPRFPNISSVPEDRLPNKLPNKLPAPTASRSPSAPGAAVPNASAHFGSVHAPRAPARTEFTWSPVRAKPMPMPMPRPAAPAWARVPQATPATRPQPSPKPSAKPLQHQTATSLQGALNSLQRDLNTLSAKGTPTLAQARKWLDQMQATLNAGVAQLGRQVKLLPSPLQATASAQLGQLQAAWERWAPGALNNLEAFGKGASDNLGSALQILGGFAAVLQTMQKIGG